MATRAAVTFGEVLIVAAVVLLIAGLILPALTPRVHVHRDTASCGNNQREIFTAIIAYSQDCDASPAMNLPAAHDAREARLTTVRAFARLAVVENLPARLFRCRADPSSGADATSSPVAALAWGATAAHHVAYAYDWAAPDDAGGARIVIADRKPTHGGRSMVVYADCHGECMRGGNGGRTGGHRTEDASGAAVTSLLMHDATATSTEDSIYDDVGDDGDPLTPGKGSATRAWVK